MLPLLANQAGALMMLGTRGGYGASDEVPAYPENLACRRLGDENWGGSTFDLFGPADIKCSLRPFRSARYVPY
jgi:hypothetical protein